MKMVLKLLFAACFSMFLESTPARSQPSKATSINVAEAKLIEMERELNEGRSVEIRGVNCATEKTSRSIHDKTRTVVQLRNNSSKDVVYYWLSYEGTREYKRTLMTGEAHNVRTYVTHPFIVVDRADRCVAIYHTQTKPGRIVIRD